MPASHRIAGLPLTIRPALDALVHFELPSSATATPLPSELADPGLLPDEDLGPPWRGRAEGLLDGGIVPVEVALASPGVTLRFRGSEILARRGGSGVELLSEAGPPDSWEQAMLGPGLCLALALRGVVCLHASAALRDGRVFLFVGESGAGKSTLARAFDQSRGWRRVADDCLPVVLARREDAPGFELLARPHFPQLKLAPHGQWPRDAPAELPIGGIYRLTTAEPAKPSVTVIPSSGRCASLALVRHSVASRLFPPRLLAWHLNWAARSSEGTPVSSLSYPRRLELLPQVVHAIERDAGVVRSAD